MSTSVFPITRLFRGVGLHTAVISGPNIQVLDTSTGDVRNRVTASAGPVRCAAVDKGFRYLATAGDDKILKIWEIDSLSLVNERELPKRPTAIQFTSEAKTILVSDKFGDVFSYTIEYTPLTEKQKKDALSSHENPSGGALILGHTSLLNAFVLSADERYIITADRDEHIRVSWFPQGYNIEMFCLGHTKFVSAIHVPVFMPSQLVSGGGDQMLKVWDWMSGTVVHEIRVWEAVERYICVRSSRRKRGVDGEDVAEVRRRGRGKKVKAKGKGKAKTEAEEEEEEEEEEAGNETLDNPPAASGNPASEEKAEKVLVINKIETTASRRIVFSAVGATALFSVDYPGDGAAADVRPLELGRPVLDFIVVEDDRIWVALDGNWVDGTEPTNQSYFLVVEVSESGELLKSTSESPIINALNSTVLLPATEVDLQKLELYNDLVAMPKGYEPENDPDGDTAPPEPEKQSKRILGRLKNKQKVLQKERELAGAVDDGTREPDVKKAKQNVGDGEQDVDMGE